MNDRSCRQETGTHTPTHASSLDEVGCNHRVVLPVDALLWRLHRNNVKRDVAPRKRLHRISDPISGFYVCNDTVQASNLLVIAKRERESRQTTKKSLALELHLS